MISFIVPAYNEERALPATLAAIHEAARGVMYPYEIVVVDDGSTDRTAEVARAAGARVERVEFRQIARTRNAGAKASQGERLVFVDADTHINETVLRAAMDALEKDAVGGGATPKFDDDAPGWAHLAMVMVVGPMKWMSLAAGCFIFAWRKPFEAAGGFDERHFAGEEIMLSRAMKKQGRFVILPERLETSSRKFVGASPWRTLWMVLKLSLKGFRGVRRREGNEFWYDGKR